eukprot:10198446-Heterocapsa_arctica.AAC.1
MVCPPCVGPSGLRKRPREDDDESEDRHLKAKRPYRSSVDPGSLLGRPKVSDQRHRPQSNAVEPARRSRRFEGDPGLPGIRRL